jgi:hypothetical protein
VGSAHVDRRGIALIVAAGASAFLVCVAPTLAADPAPDPPPTETAPAPDPAPVPEPAPSEPQPSPPTPTPVPSSSPPATSSSSPSVTQTSGSVVSSSAKRDEKPAKRKHRTVVHSSSETMPASSKWQRARNDTLAVAPTVPAGTHEAVAVRVSLPSSSSSAPFVPAALAAALATLLLAAVPSFALDASRILRPVAELRFELATIGICILVGLVVAKGLPS